MNDHVSLTRREFLTRSAQAAAAISAGAFPILAEENHARSFRVPAKQVRGIAVDARGKIAVAADNSVLVFHPDGTLAREISATQPVRAVGFDTRGRLFAAFKDQVAAITERDEITLLGEPFGGRESAVTSLAFADGGDIYAADSGTRTVWRLDAAGKVLGKIQPPQNAFAAPRAFFPIAWHGGHLIVADPGRHEIQTYTPDGRLVAKWGERSRDIAGFAGCCNPVSFAALADGTIVTAERGQPRVKAFSAAGKFSRVLAGPEDFAESIAATRADADDLTGCQSGLLQVAAGPNGAIVILDRTTREVRILA